MGNSFVQRRTAMRRDRSSPGWHHENMKTRSRKIEGNTKKRRIWEKAHGYCDLCSERLYKNKWRIDHLVPRARGGSDEEWNLLPCCVFCNSMKKAAETYKMRRVLMYGRYCLEEATRRDGDVPPAVETRRQLG